MNQQTGQFIAKVQHHTKGKAQKWCHKKKQTIDHGKEMATFASLSIASQTTTKSVASTPKDASNAEPAENEWQRYLKNEGKWLEELPSKKEELNVGWPWPEAPSPRNLLTQAPYALNEDNSEGGFFKKPQEVQTSPLFNIPRGMEAPILQILFQHHSCASKFAATCQSAFNLIASNIDHWDFTRGNFNGCHKCATHRVDTPASVNKIVVVSQFRLDNWRRENFACSMHSLHRMTHAFVNFADHFQILHLHRIPLLTTRLLEMVVPPMRKLKVLGVYRCELIHIGDTMKLLEIIRKDRIYGSGKTQKVLLDFYPRFHIGPASNPDGKGSYGVTWDNFFLDSRLAIWQLLTRILPQARKQGVDLTTKESAFRFWLDQSPCWRVEDTINAIERGDDDAALAVQVDYPNTRGRKSKLQNGMNWSVPKFRCRMCKQNVLGIFFDNEELFNFKMFGNQSDKALCLGCKLTMHLGFEEDHRKRQKHHMVEIWLGKPDSGTEEGALEEALTLESKMKGKAAAKAYDCKRRIYDAKHPGEWRQKPRVKGLRNSPSIRDREWHSFW